MNNTPKCQELFALEPLLFKNIFGEFEYPWEVIPHIQSIIERLIEDGLEGYELLAKGILVGRNVTISGGAHIEAPAIISHNCEIRHGALLRGCVILGDGCTVGNSSEIKNSILMAGAQAPHFNYVGDSILGKKAHLGAGAICSNLRSDGKAVSIRSGDTTIDTGLRKLGAILGDGVEIGCGSVLCPGTIIGKNTAVYPLTVTRGTYPENSIVKDTYTVTPKH